MADRPGVLAAVAGVFGESRRVDVQSMRQRGEGDEARLIFVTHMARRPRLPRRIRRRARSSMPVEHVGSVLRVIGGEAVSGLRTFPWPGLDRGRTAQQACPSPTRRR